MNLLTSSLGRIEPGLMFSSYIYEKFQVHMYIDSREKVTARYQVIVHELNAFDNCIVS